MKYRPLKISIHYILMLALILILGLSLTILLGEREANEYEEAQRNAAERMERIEAFIKESITEKGISLEAKDLNETGLIGPDFTPLTSTMGEEGAKRSSLNPEFAALMVRYFHDAGLEKGDTVAIGSSGSFPGFLIATLAATEELGLNAKVIASLGSSMYGATRVEYNLFSILEDIERSGEAEFELLGVSCGGEGDRGGGAMEGFLYEGSAILSYEITKAEAERSGAYFIHEDSISQSIEVRKELYGEDVDIFVNIGGASPNLGTGSYSLDFPPGLVMGGIRIPEGKERGLIFEYLEEGIPVVNLLSVKKICQENSIVFDPVPLPSSSSSSVYSTISYNKWIVAITLLLGALTVIAARRHHKSPTSSSSPIEEEKNRIEEP